MLPLTSGTSFINAIIMPNMLKNSEVYEYLGWYFRHDRIDDFRVLDEDDNACK